MPALRHSMTGCNNMEHRCTRCDLFKSVEMFPKNKETPCGYDPRCKQCRHEARRQRMGAKVEKPRAQDDNERLLRRANTVKKYIEGNKEKLRVNNRVWKLKTNFNMTLEQYAWLLLQQNSVCFLCEQAETRIDSRTGLIMNLAVDHDRKCCSGIKSCGRCVRGLLCTDCNTSLGKLECKPKLVEKLNLGQYIHRRPLENYVSSTRKQS
jgi:hypothetical protein